MCYSPAVRPVYWEKLCPRSTVWPLLHMQIRPSRHDRISTKIYTWPLLSVLVQWWTNWIGKEYVVQNANGTFTAILNDFEEVR